MSYFPEDIPFMSEAERKANGIKTAKEIETQKMQLSKEDATFDCVSRQQMIDRIEWWFEILKQNPDILIDAIKTLSSAQPTPHWIPCSERLPKMGQPVIDNYASLNWLSFCSDGKEWAFQRPGEIISWYPLPEPYQGEGEQDAES